MRDGFDIAALMGFFGLTSAFALVGHVLAGWMCWRIVEKAGLPGWAGLGAILLTLTGMGSLVLADPALGLRLHALAARRARRRVARLWRGAGGGAPGPRRPALCRRRPQRWPTGAAWKLAGSGVALAFDGSAGSLCPDRRAGRAAHRATRWPIRRSAGRMPGC